MAFTTLTNQPATDPQIVDIPRERGETTATSNLARDRIAQSYLGLHGNPETQNRSRRRVNWMAAQATGPRVLDIGCSEGILAILLAREGYAVTGVDVNVEALEYAEKLLEGENAFVTQRVQLVNGDMMTAELDEEPFDTVMLGEVLEHLTHPALMVERAMKHLRPGGRFVMTTPFGYFPHHDHRQSFVTSAIVELLRPHCTPLRFAVADGYFLFVGTRSEAPDWSNYDAAALLALTEQEAIEQQRNLRAQLDAVNAMNQRLRQGNAKQTTELEQLRGENTGLKTRIEALTAAEAQLALEVRYLKEGAEKAERGASLILGELQSRRSEQTRIEERLAQINAELVESRIALGTRDAELAGLRARLEQAEGTHAKELAALQAEAEAASQRHADELKALRGEAQTTAQRHADEVNDLRAGARQAAQQHAADLAHERELALAAASRHAAELAREREQVSQATQAQAAEAATLREQANAAQRAHLAELEALRTQAEERGRVHDSTLLALRARAEDAARQAAEEKHALLRRLTASEEAADRSRDGLAAMRQHLRTAELARMAGEELERDLREQLATAEQNLAENELAARQAQGELEELQLARTRAEQRHIAAQAQVEELQREGDARREELQAATQQTEELTRNLKSARNEAKKATEAFNALRATLGKREELIAQLNRELDRLRHEQGMLVKAEYRSRSRALDAERNVGYRIAARLRRLWLDSGRILAEKIARHRRRKWDPVVLTLEVSAMQPQPRLVRFSCATPGSLTCEGGRIRFDVPAGESVLLISKENARISQPPRKKQLRLGLMERYVITGETTLNGGEARLHLLEYHTDRFLQGQEFPLATGPLQAAWETHEEHRRLCLALELRGKGELTLSALSIAPDEQPEQAAHSIMLRRTDEAGARVRLTRRPRWRSLNVQPGETILVRGAISFEDATDIRAGFALARVEYYDALGKRLNGPFEKAHFSRRVGDFVYLRCPDEPGRLQDLVKLHVPAQARSLRLGFQAWNARKSSYLVNMLELVRPVEIPEALRLNPVAAQQPGPAQGRTSERATRAAALKRECSVAGWIDRDTPPDPTRPTVLTVMDEFTTSCFASECNLIRPRPDNWEALAEHYRPQLIFIESAWQGNGRSWQYRVGQYSNSPGNELETMAQYARTKGIPLVFWNKEDPVHHLKFIEASKLAHTIFTTDACMIESYREKTGNARVFALPFAAQPSLHRPAPLAGRRMASCFAGSWYGGRHVERCEAMHYLLESARPFGLDIYDRNFGTGGFPFPEIFQPHVRGSLPYDRLCAEYARYRVFLNVNSVFESPTMFSRRVFELMACGTPVVSTYARGIEEILGTDAVWLVRNAQETQEAVRTLMEDDSEWRRRSLAGIRRVFSGHTYAHRLAEVQQRAGLCELRPVEPRTLLMAQAGTVDDLRRLAEFYLEQSWRPFELVVLTDFLESAAQILPAGVRAVKMPEQRAAWLADELTQGKFALFGWIDHRAYYGPHYLQDLVNATRYAPGSDVLGKAQDTREFTPEGLLDASGCLIRAAAATREAEAIMRLPQGWTGGLPAGLSSYAADREEFIAATD